MITTRSHYPPVAQAYTVRLKQAIGVFCEYACVYAFAVGEPVVIFPLNEADGVKRVGFSLNEMVAGVMDYKDSPAFFDCAEREALDSKSLSALNGKLSSAAITGKYLLPQAKPLSNSFQIAPYENLSDYQGDAFAIKGTKHVNHRKLLTQVFGPYAFPDNVEEYPNHDEHYFMVRTILSQRYNEFECFRIYKSAEYGTLMLQGKNGQPNKQVWHLRNSILKHIQ